MSLDKDKDGKVRQGEALEKVIDGFTKRRFSSREFILAAVVMVLGAAMTLISVFVDNPETSQLLIIIGSLKTFLGGSFYEVIRTFQKNSENKVKSAAALAMLEGGGTENP